MANLRDRMSSLQLSHLLRAFSTAQGVTARKVVRSYLAVVPALRRQACGARYGTSCPAGRFGDGIVWLTVVDGLVSDRHIDD